MSSGHISGSPRKYHISGELVNTNMEFIRQVLDCVFGDDHVRVKSQNDVSVDDDGLSLNIYSYRSVGQGGRDYLIGGNCYRDYDYAYQLCRRLAEELEGRGVLYSVELDDLSSVPQHPTVTFAHHDYQSYLRQQSKADEPPDSD